MWVVGLLLTVSPNHEGCRVTILKESVQTFRMAIFKTDTANLSAASSDVGSASLDRAGNRFGVQD